MFNTQDNVIRIGMFLMGLMLLMYGGMMTFNLEFFFSRYPTINADQTNSFFITWTGINTLAFLMFIVIMIVISIIIFLALVAFGITSIIAILMGIIPLIVLYLILMFIAF